MSGINLDREDLTEEELKALRALDRLARIWPETLTLVSMGGSLHALRSDEMYPAGGRFGDGISQDAIVWSDMSRITNTGGDW